MITKASTSLFNFILIIIKPYKKLISLIALMGCLWAFINTFIPYALKLMIDHVVSFEENRTHLFTSSILYILFYLSLWLALTITLRINDWARLKLFPTLREDIMTSMFNYTNQHSHKYFQNNFA